MKTVLRPKASVKPAQKSKDLTHASHALMIPMLAFSRVTGDFHKATFMKCAKSYKTDNY